MIQKKVSLLGAFATGKTSLVSRFVSSIYSDKYQTTVGTKIDKKVVAIDDQEVMLVLWDIHGEDELQKVRMSYLRGSSGYLLVVDGTRRQTLDTAIRLQQSAAEAVGEIPFILVLNKVDLLDEWELDEVDVAELSSKSALTIRSSAKTGVNVEDAFLILAAKMLENQPPRSAK